MGKRSRPAKVVAVPRKPSVNSVSSRELSSSPERFLFQANDGAKSQEAPSIQASSSQSAVGLSWVTVLKSTVKHVPVPDTPPCPFDVAAQLSDPPHLESGYAIAGSMQQDSILLMGKATSSVHSLESESPLPVVTSDFGDVVEAQEQPSLPSRVCLCSDPVAPLANAFDILGQLPSNVEPQTLINKALGAHPIHGND
ncbi:unnamed protein product [Amaranthus hypochondriacus]